MGYSKTLKKRYTKKCRRKNLIGSGKRPAESRNGDSMKSKKKSKRRSKPRRG